jgi:3-phenylpropionate/trans-cinnamate dioxygenase ferredoxin subunit
MANFVEAAKVSELGDGAMKKVMLQEHEILLARAGDNYYAANNRCPHMSGDLSQGKLEGTVVTCPRHSSQFDLKDGSVVRWLKGSGVLSKIGGVLKSSRPLTTYKVTIEGDAVLVEI